MTTNIYQKLKEVRKQIGQIEKTEQNKFQNYKYVSEYTYLKKITPILNDKGLTLTFEDTDFPINFQPSGKD
jgi:ERF superfamily